MCRYCDGGNINERLAEGDAARTAVVKRSGNGSARLNQPTGYAPAIPGYNPIANAY